MGANSLGAIAADTIFVSTFSLGELSRYVAISAVLRVVASFAYAWGTERVLGPRPSQLRAARFDAALVAAAGLSFFVTALFAASPSRAALYAVCVAQLVLPPLLPLVAFNATTASLRARHAKRVLPLVAGAATAGTIATGALAGALAKPLGVAALLGLAGALTLPVPLLLFALARKTDEAESVVVSSGQREPARGLLATLGDTARDAFAIPAVRVVVAFAFFGAMATSFVEYAFKAALKSHYTAQDLAVALGVYGVVSNSIVLGLQLFVTGPLVARLGVGRTLSVGPVLLGATSLAAFALPPVIGTGLARLAETIVRYGVGNSVADVLLVPLARAVRTRAKVVVKGAASPLGALVAGGLLSLFGEGGPPYAAQLALLGTACVVLFLFVRRAPSAYADALATALSGGRSQLDVTPEAALVFRAAMRRELAAHVQAGRVAEAKRTLDLMTDRFCELDDARPALASPDLELRRAAVSAAARLASSGAKLLELLPPNDDPDVELSILRAAQRGGALADEARVERAIARGAKPEASGAEIELWAEGLLLRAKHGVARREKNAAEGQALLDRSLKELRKAVRDGAAATSSAGPSRCAAALRAVGTLGDRRAEREVLTVMGTRDPALFREASRAAVLLDAAGVVPSLVAQLAAGPHPATAARALALAGPRAVRELIQALPTTRGEGAIAPTAVAESRVVSGSVRAARALARIGDAASSAVLPMFGQLGHRARIAVAHAFGARKVDVVGDDRREVERAIETLVGYGRSLLPHRRTDPGLLPWEIERRILENVEGVFDLLVALGEPAAVGRAKAAALGAIPGHDNALELVETLLAPRGADVARFLAEATAAPKDKPQHSGAPALDGWLEKVRKFDRGELPLSDPMLGVLEKVIVLRDVPLFGGLSGEDLYPVAEIAAVEDLSEPTEIVRQGEPSNDLYVVLEGTLAVIKDGARVAELGPKKTFGELGVLDGEPRAATVKSDGPVRLLRIPRGELEALLDESPELARGIIRTLLGYVRAKGS